MAKAKWNSFGESERRWKKQRIGRTSARTRIAAAVILLAATLCGWLAWRGVEWVLHGRRIRDGRAVSLNAVRGPSVPMWQTEVRNWLDAAARDATSTDATAAEEDVDRAASLVTGALVYKKTAPADFFDLTTAALDHVQREQPENERLNQHVTLARIELAQLRSAENEAPPGIPIPPSSPLDTEPTAHTGPAGGSPSGGAKGAAASGFNRVEVSAPRNAATNSALNPKSLGGTFLDAALMPDDAEILEPPVSRLLSDGVRVEGLTIAGAAQTLDGIHWKDVTFVGTRVRYDGGELDLQNVKFVRCIFGFSPDANGGRLATTIALGQTSLTIE